MTSYWFVVKDVCEALGLKYVGDAVGKLDEDEKGLYPIQTPGGTQNVAVLSESGLYALVMRCRDAMTAGKRGSWEGGLVVKI
jgi:prophage antirepressor-like protein